MPAPVPLGPDSTTWTYFGDWRNMLVVLWAGSLQNMHPRLGVAVEQHSQFFQERWQRVFRSFYPILGVVYDGPHAPQTALKVREYHAAIQGEDSHGRRYHALEPDLFYWGHAVFFMTMIRFGDRFMGGVTEAERRLLFEEHVQWYRLYRLTMRPVPETWDDFQRYWEHVCVHVLEDTRAARDVLDLRGVERPPFMMWLPGAWWSRGWQVFARAFVWLTVGLYDPVIRERLGFEWSEADERWHRRLGRLVHRVFMLIPKEWRFHPRARTAWHRTRGRDVPLIESPPRHHARLGPIRPPRHT
ncbi:oxygenase MpaB family protein [Micromonospora sp. NPDC050795]|uniref:oxygenase MpaB family protein n=1 Tax=Micromonospora sp. NPDC050795 TaxID=3364282 RepID=UPI0037925A07